MKEIIRYVGFTVTDGKTSATWKDILCTFNLESEVDIPDAALNMFQKLWSDCKVNIDYISLGKL